MNPRVSLLSCLVFLLVGAAALAAPAPVKAPEPNRESPERVQEVMAGKRTEANALWWGFNETDATASLQAAINSGARRLVIPNTGKEWVVTPITLASDQEILFERGAIIAAKRGAFKGKGDCLFRASGARNITLQGYGATLRMNKSDYQGPDYEKAEWRHSLSFISCTNVRVLGLTLRESGGDGIYLGSAGGEQPYCKDIVIRDVVCDSQHRQGISVISAENLLIERTTLKDTSGTAPMAGIDFEPNSPRERLVNCTMRDCVCEANAGAGITFYLGPLSTETVPISARIERCRVEGSGGAGLSVAGSKTGGLRGAVTFADCRSRATGGPAASVRLAAGDTLRVTYERCDLADACARRPGQAPIALSVAGGAEGESRCAVDFVDCTLEDRAGRPFLSAGGTWPGGATLAVAGKMTVRSPFGARMHLSPGVEVAGLKVDAVRIAGVPAVRMKPLHPEVRPAAPPAPIAMRGAATYALYARKGESVAASVACRRVGRYEDGLAFYLVSPTGKMLAEGDVAPGQAQEVRFDAAEEGTSLLVCAAGQNASEVTTAGAMAVLVPEGGLSLLQPQRALYFWVPAGTEPLALTVAGQGEAECVRAALVGPAGKVVEDQDGISGTAPHAFALPRPAAGPGEVWSVRLSRATGKVLEDVQITPRGGVPAAVSFDPNAVLVPDPAGK